MVSFQCEGCQDVVKKPKLDTHHGRCHASFSCIDCHTTYASPNEWKGHTFCMTEEEKSQKSLYKGKKNKGGGGAQKASQKGSSTKASQEEVPSTLAPEDHPQTVPHSSGAHDAMAEKSNEQPAPANVTEPETKKKDEKEDLSASALSGEHPDDERSGRERKRRRVSVDGAEKKDSQEGEARKGKKQLGAPEETPLGTDSGISDKKDKKKKEDESARKRKDNKKKGVNDAVSGLDVDTRSTNKEELAQIKKPGAETKTDGLVDEKKEKNKKTKKRKADKKDIGDAVPDGTANVKTSIEAVKMSNQGEAAGDHDIVTGTVTNSTPASTGENQDQDSANKPKLDEKGGENGVDTPVPIAESGKKVKVTSKEKKEEKEKTQVKVKKTEADKKKEGKEKEEKKSKNRQGKEGKVKAMS